VGHGHRHAAPDGDLRSGRRERLVVAAALLPFVLGTVVGLILLWPAHHTFRLPAQFSTGSGPVHTVAGRVLAAGSAACGGPGDTSGSVLPGGSAGPPATDAGGATGSYRCTRVTVAIRSGPDKGHDTALEFSPGPGQPVLRAGDDIRLARTRDPASGLPFYDFADFARGVPLAWLAAAFALVVTAVGRWRGLAALAGLGVAFVVLVEFVLPGLLSAEDPLSLALVGGAAIMIVVLPLAHGVSVRTSVALLGTLAALGLTGLLAALAVHLTHLTGLGSEENTAVQAYAGQVKITGLILAGFVIGSLGVLNDITVTQASAVWELQAADATGARRRSYGRAMRIGRDHIASTIYTLVLAYAGAALPALLLFTVAGRGPRDVITSDLVAGEVVRSLVGAIGLVLAVPLTTALAAALAPRRVG
jgi:uncharacterized membrane protein